MPDTIPPPAPATAQATGPRHAYAWTLVACGATLLLTQPLLGRIDLSNIVMLYLLTVALVALRLGSGPAVLAAVLSVALFDFFYVPPRFTMAVADGQYLITFAVMLVVGLAIGQLTARLREKADLAAARASATQALYALARQLAAAFAPEQVAQIVGEFLARRAGVAALLFLPDDQGGLTVLPPGAVPADWPQAHVRAAFETGSSQWLAARETHYEPGIAIPLLVQDVARGVLLAHSPSVADVGAPEQRALLDAVASLTALTVERLHYSAVAQRVQVQMASEQLRSAVLSAVSHDLRTPLTVLVGLADTLAQPAPADPATQQETALAIRTQALRLSAQVDKLLDMARLQAGAVSLQREWQLLDEVVGSALRLLGVSPNTARIVVDDLRALPWLFIDTTLMESVLVNVLENALKYAPEGAIHVAARCCDGCIEISVCDAGPGIPAGARERIFDLFVRGDEESASTGTGLGLAICRAIVRAHGGEIAVHDALGGGACFVIRLPAGTPPPLPDADDEPA